MGLEEEKKTARNKSKPVSINPSIYMYGCKKPNAHLQFTEELVNRSFVFAYKIQNEQMDKQNNYALL